VTRALQVLVLSPHFDDAVYSCGAALRQMVRSGGAVTVATLMGGDAGGTAPDTPLVRDLWRRWGAGDDPIAARRAEDAAAIGALGARAAWLPIPDCPLRGVAGRALYPDEASLWGALAPDDPAPAALRALAWPDLYGQPNPPDLLLAPLGAGRHVDHRVTRDYALWLAEGGVALRFYADFPYARDAQAVALALQENPLRLVARPVVASTADLADKLHAMALYRSQMGTFWRSEGEMRVDVVGYMERAGGGLPAELCFDVHAAAGG
jgi:LmbE family N-acetylglucosaminyl deacetylase